MSGRPQPSAGSQSLDSYEAGARVYYHRSGIRAAGTIAVQVELTLYLQANGVLRRSEVLKVVGNDML